MMNEGEQYKYRCRETVNAINSHNFWQQHAQCNSVSTRIYNEKWKEKPRPPSAMRTIICVTIILYFSFRTHFGLKTLLLVYRQYRCILLFATNTGKVETNLFLFLLFYFISSPQRKSVLLKTNVIRYNRIYWEYYEVKPPPPEWYYETIYI